MQSFATRLIAVLALALLAAYGGWSERGVRADLAATQASKELGEANLRAQKLEASVLQMQVKKTSDSSARITEDAPKQEVITQTVIKEVIKYVQSPDHGKCAMPAEWVCQYNASLGLPCAGTVPSA